MLRLLAPVAGIPAVLAISVAVSLAAMMAAPARAHHSIAGVFDMNSPMTLKGKIVKVDWINPHTYVHLEVAGEDGAVTVWALESIPPAMMRRAGLTRDRIQGEDGETVEVLAIPARRTENLAYILTITYEAGHFYQLSTN